MPICKNRFQLKREKYKMSVNLSLILNKILKTCLGRINYYKNQKILNSKLTLIDNLLRHKKDI